MSGLIVFINGPFGVGKTTTANLLARHVKSAYLFDPEVVGDFLHKLPGQWRKPRDFQQYKLWTLSVVVIPLLLAIVFRRTVIVPMTIWNRTRWLWISKSLRLFHPDLITLRLRCSEATLRERILRRPESEGGHDWCLSHLDRGMEIIGSDCFGQAVETENVSPEQVANVIVWILTSRGHSRVIKKPTCQ